jgi:hypothetical protein
MAIFSQTRADLYDFAGRQQRDKVANLSTTPDHLVTMLFERTGGKYLVTYGDIVDYLAPTFDEARQLGTLRMLTFNKVVEMFDDGEREIEKTSLVTEIVDYLYDRLHLHRDAKTYDLLDIIGVFGPELQQVDKIIDDD